jgi:hypothetical protein
MESYHANIPSNDSAAGLRLTRIIPTPSPYSIVEAVKAR